MTQEDELEHKHFVQVIHSFLNYREIHTNRTKARIAAIQNKEKLMPVVQRLSSHIDCINRNAFVIHRILENPPQFASAMDIDSNHSIADDASPENTSKVVSVLRQFAREWSKEGKQERLSTYDFILNALNSCFPDRNERRHLNILIPGMLNGKNIPNYYTILCYH